MIHQLFGHNPAEVGMIRARASKFEFDPTIYPYYQVYSVAFVLQADGHGAAVRRLYLHVTANGATFSTLLQIF